MKPTALSDGIFRWHGVSCACICMSPLCSTKSLYRVSKVRRKMVRQCHDKLITRISVYPQIRFRQDNKNSSTFYRFYCNSLSACFQIIWIFGLTSIKHRAKTLASGQCLIEVDPAVFAVVIWTSVFDKTLYLQNNHPFHNYKNCIIFKCNGQDGGAPPLSDSMNNQFPCVYIPGYQIAIKCCIRHANTVMRSCH